jgi:hypothetical protein
MDKRPGPDGPEGTEETEGPDGPDGPESSVVYKESDKSELSILYEGAGRVDGPEAPDAYSCAASKSFCAVAMIAVCRAIVRRLLLISRTAAARLAIALDRVAFALITCEDA